MVTYLGWQQKANSTAKHLQVPNTFSLNVLAKVQIN